MATSALTRRPAPALRTDALLVEIRAEQVRQGALLDRILAALERERGPRDQADRALVVSIAAAMRDHTFTSGQLIAHATADMDLRDALEHADITSALDLGQRLRRVEGTAIGGVRIARVDGDYRAGILWRCEVCEV